MVIPPALKSTDQAVGLLICICTPRALQNADMAPAGLPGPPRGSAASGHVSTL